MSSIDKIFSETKFLNDIEKLQLVDKILISLNPVNHGVDAVWAEEAEERITAYGEGRVSTIDEKSVLAKYSK